MAATESEGSALPDGSGSEVTFALLDGRYLALRTLGTGGLATVYLCEGRDGLRRAIKVTRSTDARYAGALIREARLLGLLHHANVPAVEEYGYLKDGRSYCVMDWCDGTPLDRVLISTRPTQIESLHLMRALASVVEAVHEAGILHRDLKPGNVIVPDIHGKHDYASARLVDFGVSLRLRFNDIQQATDFGRISGTPLYMAPEQLAGRRQTTATDVYGLGVLLYELLFGRPPFADEELIEVKSTEDLPRAFAGRFVVRRLTEDVIPPAQPAIPPRLANLLAHALALSPERRLASAAAFRDVIETVLQETSLHMKRAHGNGESADAA